MEKYEMKEIHTKEELTKVFEEEEDLVIVQHKRVARAKVCRTSAVSTTDQGSAYVYSADGTEKNSWNTLCGHDNDHGTGKGIVCDCPFT